MLTFEHWGLIDYDQALDRQLDLLHKIADGTSPDTLIFCTHPPVVTLGRKTQQGDVFAWDGPIKDISRGGRATYHGPSQLLVYPLINLDRNDLKHRAQRDVHAFLRKIENAIVLTLKEFNISAVGKNNEDETGVWVESQKIASLGIGVKRWVTYHGAAINLDQDEKAFYGMKPCGFANSIMTNAEHLLQAPIDRKKFETILKSILIETL